MSNKDLRLSLKKKYGKNWKLSYMQMSGNYSDLAIDEYIKRQGVNNDKR